MADILIRGVRMPIACSDCPSRKVSVCAWMDDYNVKRYQFSRPSFCPLHELPEHGDLIDVSKIILEYAGLAKIGYSDFVGTAKYFAEQIKSQPVIIPASKEESE